MSEKDTEKKHHDDDAKEREALERARRARNAHDDDSTTPDGDKKKNKGPSKGSAYEEYLYGRSIVATGLYKPNWASTTHGRIAIRLVSRGVFGAAAYVIGGNYAARKMSGYDSAARPKNGLQWVAKGFDTVFGKPIQWGSSLLTEKRWATGAVNFRPKRYFHQKPGLKGGRSLGHEMITVTFDFSSMSFGDAIARNVIQAFDPNLPQPWYKDKNGNATIRRKGKFDFDEWTRSLVRASWRSVTKNAGEDWFAALPYVYQMKWQRQALAKVFPGFKLPSDLNKNGATRRINAKGDIVGDYELAGVLDLQGRFVGYNVYTLIYRELYDTISHAIGKARRGELHFHPHISEHPLTSIADGIGVGIRYGIKSFIKANLFMQPAVPFFWFMRVPQSRWRSEILLDGADSKPNQNSLASYLPTALGRQRHKDDPYSHVFDYPAKYVWGGGTIHDDRRPEYVYFSKQKVRVNPELWDKGPYALSNCKTVTSKALNSFGWASFKSGSALTRVADRLMPMTHIKDPVARKKALAARETNLRNYVDAAFAYTPYFAAKDEFGLRVNDTAADGTPGQMDKVIYSFIDNVATFRFHKAGHSLGQMWNLYKTGLDVVNTEAKNAEGDLAKEQLAKLAKAKQHPQGNTAQPSTRIQTGTKMQPSTKVQATTVQYNTAPPTHLKHSAPGDTVTQAAPAPVDGQNTDDNNNKRWAESVSGRKLSAYFPQTQSTVH